MKSTRNYLIAVLALATAGAGGFAWQEYQQLAALRGSTLSASERASLQKRLQEAQDRVRELEAQLAAALGNGTGPADAAATTADATATDARGGRAFGGRANMTPAQQAAVQAILQGPQAQALQKAALDARYAALIKNLNLTPEQGDKLKGLIADSMSARQDAMAAARAAGIDPQTDRAGFQKLIGDAQAQTDAAIKNAIGDSGFAAYQQYNQTMPQRNVVNQLQQQLALGGSAMTSDQTEQLVQILASNAGQQRGGGAFAGGGGGGFGGGGFGGGGGLGALTGGLGGGGGRGGFGGGVQITNAAITQAQTILAPAQVQALQQLQQTEQAQQQVQRQIQQATGGGGRGGRRGATTGQ